MSDPSDLPRTVDLAAGQRRVLTVVAGGARTARAVKRALDTVSPHVYEQLACLEEYGLVDSEEVGPNGKQQWTLTDRGRAWFRRERAWEDAHLDGVLEGSERRVAVAEDT